MSECCAAGSARPTCERLADELPDIKCPCGRNDGERTPRRCPCFLHYHPPRDWWHLTCACECDHESEDQ